MILAWHQQAHCHTQKAGQYGCSQHARACTTLVVDDMPAGRAVSASMYGSRTQSSRLPKFWGTGRARHLSAALHVLYGAANLVVGARSAVELECSAIPMALTAAPKPRAPRCRRSGLPCSAPRSLGAVPPGRLGAWVELALPA